MVRAGPLAPRAAAIENPRLMIALIAVIERAKDERHGHSKSCDVSDHNTQLAPGARQITQASTVRCRSIACGPWDTANSALPVPCIANEPGQIVEGPQAPLPPIPTHTRHGSFSSANSPSVPQVSCEVTRWGSCGYRPRGPERIVSLRL
jgi:hypothetical protein